MISWFFSFILVFLFIISNGNEASIVEKTFNLIGQMKIKDSVSSDSNSIIKDDCTESISTKESSVEKDEKMKASSQSISNFISRKEKKWSNSNSNRIMRINQVLHEIYHGHGSGISKNDALTNISLMIGDYDYHDVSFENVNLQVMNKMNMNMEERIILDFYDESFARNFLLILSTREIIFFPFDLFWYDLIKLFFKWMIYMREETAVKDDNKFKKISQDIRLVTNIIKDNSNLHLPFDFNLKFMDRDTFNEFRELMISEFFEHAQIFSLLPSIIKYFYDNRGRMSKSIIFTKLKSTYFPNENLNSDILLKYLITMYDLKGEIRDCILESDYHMSRLIIPLFPSRKMTFQYIENLRFLNSIDLEFINMGHVTESIIKLFLLTNQRFRITGSQKLVDLLRRLNESKLLKSEIIKQIIGFEFNHGLLEWNYVLFDRLLKDSFNDGYIVKSEYLLYLCLFNQPQIIMKWNEY